MAQRVVIDPITRIEGHLRIEVETENGKITEAVSSGTIFRGIELIVQNRDPRDVWAFVQRICGVCTHVHAVASLRAVEDALGIKIPKNANHIRNIMTAAQFVQDHIIHFYHLHGVDWIDVVNALKADPKATSQLAQSISPWPNSSVGYFTDVQNKLKKFVESGQLGIFANGYWGHSAYRLPPEVNLLATAHYLEALDWQKDIAKIHTIFGGKNPHPNYLVGGMACAINIDNDNTLNMERLDVVAEEIKKAITFVEQVYLPDLLAIASFYKTELWGGGIGNYLAYGGMPATDIREPESYLFPSGAILNRNLNEVLPVDPRDPNQIQEVIEHSWYEYSSGAKALHPWDGETKVKYTGPKPPYETLDQNGKYSWIKTPRWKGNPMEVGPLARTLVAYAKGKEDVKTVVDDSLRKLGVGKEALFSTLGRTLARGLETKLCAGYLKKFYDDLITNIKSGDQNVFEGKKWDPSTWPNQAKGLGIFEAPRGALGHWIIIEHGKVKAYQAVVPTTWNAAPRDGQGNRGAYEASLLQTPMVDPNKPLELLRTIHSFDPCLACSTHILDKEHREVLKIQVR
ncbi:MAG TPA: nickel-dependent hydrogenase large subunit [Verrucomicrobiae bacterium]|nr:nickel-dependent hydrogenase large subunit [Verrucomicrobiae bacterium]